MRKVYFLLLAMVCPAQSFAQAIPNVGMESWRSTTAGSSTVQAPLSWYGSDSTIIGLGESPLVVLALGTTDADWNRQIFQESTIVHSGTYSAKIMTAYEDSFLISGVITNAIPSVKISISPPGIKSISFSGGTAATEKPTSVSAWVQYYPGKDSTGATGIDSGLLTIVALGHLGGKDSVIGTGAVSIGPSSSWVQITANVNYPIDSTTAVDTFQITFSSSKKQIGGLDSSTLYVDDLGMTTVTNPVNSVTQISSGSHEVILYPNPASETLYLTGRQNAELKATLYSMNGQAVATKAFTGNDVLDVATLPSGLYFYSIYDNSGNVVQRGKVAVTR